MKPSTTTMRPTAHFANTRWTLVITAVQTDPVLAQRALQELCTQYWYPVYTYLRHSGHPSMLAEEICIAFFDDLLRSPVLVAAAPSQGRFRDFLLAALRRFLAVDWRETEECGDGDGRAALATPDGDELEERHRHEPAGLRPESAFHRGFALDLIANAYRRLRWEAVGAGREDMFEALAPYLGADAETGRLDCIARQLEVRPLALLLALQRLRQRFRELVETEVTQTVVDSDAEHTRERAMLMAILQ